MRRPILLAVDDEPDVLRSIERDLKDRYSDRYRILAVGSGPDALTAIHQLKERGDTVALLLCDQRMPEVEGTDVLSDALTLYPDAKKVLLTAYADTGAAIRSINEIQLDHYLMKPWDPPEEGLYPVLDDLLEAWRMTVRPDYDGVRVAGTLWSAKSYAVKDFLARNRIPYRWLDVERDETAKALVEGLKEGAKLPVVFLPDGTVLADPSRGQIADALKMRVHASERYYDLIVIGGGPAGLAAAVYGASEGLSTALVEQEATGGQAGTSSRIENYLGFPGGLSGSELAQRATAQAERLGAELLVPLAVTKIRLEGDYKILTFAEGNEVTCRAVILATGMKVRLHEADGCQLLTGIGVYYGAAMSEARSHKDQPVAVLGGGNSAGQAALFLSRFASDVTIYIRASSLSASMSRYLIDQIEATENVHLEPQREIVSVHGTGHLESLTVRHTETGEAEDVRASALFIFIGSEPNSQLVEGLVATDDKGFVLTGADLPKLEGKPRGWALDRDPYILETNAPGIFAVGDVRGGSSKRVAAAVGEGSTAVRLVHEYLATV